MPGERTNSALEKKIYKQQDYLKSRLHSGDERNMYQEPLIKSFICREEQRS